MAKVTITLEDADDGLVSLNVDSDPDIPETEQELTQAQNAGVQATKFLIHFVLGAPEAPGEAPAA